MNQGALNHRFAWIAVAATLSLGSGGLAAQEIPEGQSCGGLVCDLGLFGHKTAPKPAPEPAAAGVPVPPPQRAAARPEPPQEQKRAALHKKAHVAKAPSAKAATPPKALPRATASGAGFGAAPVATTLSPPTAPAAPPPAASPVATALNPPPSMMAPPAPPPIPVTAPSPPVVLSNPYVYSRPLPFMFQSVDPTQSVQ